MKKIIVTYVSVTLTLITLLLACNQRPTEKTDNGIADTTSRFSGKIQMDGELPAKESIPVLFDEIDFQQACQLYLWALPIVAMQTMKETQEKVFGATSSDIVVYNTYEDKLGILTANATTPYMLSFINLSKTGPFVLDIPAGHIAGGISDMWQREVLAIGEAGADKGQGGKYLILGPAQQATKPPGYHVVVNPTNTFLLALRALDPDPEQQKATIQGVKLYPYEQRVNPPQTKIITPGGKKALMMQPSGLSYWGMLHRAIQDEPVEERDRFFMAWLDNLGIKKGQHYNPNEKQREILTAGAEKGQLMAIAISFRKRFDSVRHWPDRQWDYVIMMRDPSQRVANFDEFFPRTAYFYEAVGQGKSMISKTPNVGQAYLGAYADKNGNWLNGSKNYTLHIPANAPAANFWSVTVYDAATRCLIDNPQRNADLSSRKDLIKNSDGSVDLYFGPKSPAGKEKNWVQTLDGKHWFTYMRFYGPTEAYFNRSWKMGDVEEAK